VLKPAIFLDRDGVINVDNGYIHKVSDFIWIEGAKKAIRYINSLDYYAIIVTNQSGISRGYYSEESVIKLHSYINKKLKEVGANIDDFFYSPFHPDGIISKYKKNSNLRKPNTGMLELACKKWPIKIENSILIGDSQTDMQCAKNFGIDGYLYNNKETDLFNFIKNII
tara:strand:+ start:40 stop:543 length:504 start_codon:yes stop_codon:yes gene_type:complete